MKALMVPACEKGMGGGHFLRAAFLVRELRKRGGDAFLYVKNREDPSGIVSAAFPSGICSEEWLVSGLFPDGGEGRSPQWDFIVLDRFRTPPREYLFWSAMAPVIGIDEGGPFRDQFDFLVDLLPGLYGKSRPNIADPSLLFLPEKRKSPGTGLFKDGVKPLQSGESRPRILVGFGAEDGAGLGEEVCRALLQTADIFDISAVSSRPAEMEPEESGKDGPIRRIAPSPGFRERLFEYDLVITHFGITAFEALAAGLSVILVSPGAYHEKLARASGFYSAGIRGGGKLPGLLCMEKGKSRSVNHAFFSMLRVKCERLAARYGLTGRQNRTLADLLAAINPEIFRVCPVCAGDFARNAGIVRFGERTYRRCSRCGVIVMNSLVPPPVEYEREYFFGFYKKQYGKTYLEDFPGLLLQARRRLAIIKSLLPPGPGRGAILDIGCAYGPFLAAAKDEGFSPVGIEPAGDAAAWARRELGVPVHQGFFPQNPPPAFLEDGHFDAVTLWYVIEHFEHPGEALGEIRRILKTGGTLAFSTPSVSGISGLKSVEKFLEASPADHRTVWNPHTCKKLMKMAGFTVKKIVISGHHPERFPLAGRLAAGGKGPLYAALLFTSRAFGLGDTFEVYAVKDGGNAGRPRKTAKDKP
ncbi:MAG: methyltransferase domain-containing protein [Treponema sp.]|jgi:SAM-dependent methyltransferase|nr:methyltransferase domain-containing protein [Treponema sp.]